MLQVTTVIRWLLRVVLVLFLAWPEAFWESLRARKLLLLRLHSSMVSETFVSHLHG